MTAQQFIELAQRQATEVDQLRTRQLKRDGWIYDSILRAWIYRDTKQEAQANESSRVA